MSGRFELGQTLITSGANRCIHPMEARLLLLRHHSGDWGLLCGEDMLANEDAIRSGDRIISKYRVKGRWFYVITEADRSVTTILLREEY